MNQVKNFLLPIIFIPIYLFIIASLIYDHCQRGYLFTSRSSNESLFIEQALKRIPICNSNDPPRQRDLLYTLQAWSHLAHSYHIRYWIGYKTLLGYVKYHDLSPNDIDIDILIMIEDIPQLTELTKINFSSIYELKVSNRSYFPSKEIDFIIYKARFMNQENNISINIWSVYDYYSSKNVLMLAEYMNSNKWNLSPIEWTFPLEPCVFSGIKVWCPAQPKKLVDFIYEKSPRNIACINGIWVNS